VAVVVPSHRQPLENAEAEFLLRLRERHGSLINPEAVLQTVLEELGWNFGDLSAFLDFEKKQTTAPQKLTNPPGHYRRAVQKFRQAKSKRREWDLREQQRRMEEQFRDRPSGASKPVCPYSRCDGLGEYWDESGIVSPCQCEAGAKLSSAVLELFDKLNSQRKADRS
jgi:hypothetical protein